MVVLIINRSYFASPLIMLPHSRPCRSNLQIKSHGQRLAAKWKDGENIFQSLSDADLSLFPFGTNKLTECIMRSVPFRKSYPMPENAPLSTASGFQANVDQILQIGCDPSAQEREERLGLMKAAHILCAMKIQNRSTLKGRAKSFRR